ncbi:hypothetical protein BX600DRAFT_435250 [Xylariales sp. PMI_506]|nr:hypothetical protein BX600DRAFT_435250 [Xylariales sp. PMI_506]
MGSLNEEIRIPSNLRDVAVIGGGISGITSASHLLRQGLNVTVFERSSTIGGVWHYDERVASEPPYPNIRPLKSNKQGTTTRSLNITGSFDEVSLLHAPPGPCYKGLRNNVPTSLMRSTLLSYPEGTPDFVTHDVLEAYIQSLAAHTGAQERVQLDTAVDTVFKNPETAKWIVTTRTLRKTGGAHEFLRRTWEFDAVIVASGHYHEPRVPEFPGLQDWKSRHPDGVMHSKRYRTPDIYKGKNILIIGAGASSLDIARESVGVARKVYQSSRGGQFDIPATLLPPGVERVSGVTSFALKEGEIAGQVELEDGKTLTDIDVVVLGTGYITSYPFLGDLQDPTVPTLQANDKLIVSRDGCITHNLYKDIFYIPDPTLAFVGVPYYTSTFSLFDFQAEVVSRVLAGNSLLPAQSVLAEDYEARKLDLVEGSKTFHSLLGREVEYMNSILEWVNQSATKLGQERMNGVDDRWLERYAFFIAEMKKRRLADKSSTDNSDLIGGGLRISVGVASA